MPYADEFDTASAIEDMANTLDQASRGSIDWGRGPEGNEGIVNRGTTSSGVQSVEWDGNLIGTPIQQETSPILDEAAYQRIMDHMRQDQEAEQPANITDQIIRNKSSLETSNGVMDWGQGPEGSEGTIDLGENPSLQALQDALGGGGADPLAGKADFMQKNETPLDPAKAGADVNAFLAATRGSDIRRQEELGITPSRPNTFEDYIQQGANLWDRNLQTDAGGKMPAGSVMPTGGGQGWVNPNASFGELEAQFSTSPQVSPRMAPMGGDTRGDNPVDIIRSTYAWASSLPNNVLFNAARYPDYLRLLIEHDAAGKDLPLTVPSWILEETARPEGAP